MSKSNLPETKEVFHRVKNNLQVMSSLVELQLMEAGNQEVRAALDEVIGRLQVFVVIYRQLLPDEGFAAVEFGNVVKELWQARVASQSILSDPSLINVDVPDLILTLEIAIPMALVINELITISSQSDPAGQQNREISIQYLDRKDEKHRIMYRDSALRSIAGGAESSKEDTFGRRLISGLSHQIGGSVSFPDAEADHFIVTFASKRIRE